MLTTDVIKKLVVFGIITIVSVAIAFGGYMRGLEGVGYGVYHVTLYLPDSSGLYPNAQVSYRGVDVGLVDQLTAHDKGVAVDLRLRDDHPIPAELDAEVRSMSAIGEQYIDLVPRSGRSRSAVLADGATIGADRVSLPVSNATFLRTGSRFLSSVPLDDLATAVDEFSAGWSGAGGDLGRLLDNAIGFQAAADDNLRPTIRLLDDLQTVLETQDESRKQTASYLDDLSQFTGVMVKRDDDWRSLIRDGSTLARDADHFASGLNEELPSVVADLVTTLAVIGFYDGNVESILSVFPAIVAAVQSSIPADRLDDDVPRISLNFKASVNTPPTCIDGYPEARSIRSPHDLSYRPPPTDSYCKIPHDDIRVVRGARNVPCAHQPGKRAATPLLCGTKFKRFVPGGQ